MWLSLWSGWPELRYTFCKLFPRAFLMSDEKISYLQVVLWCHNMSDWWCKDMCKLVWWYNLMTRYILRVYYVIRNDYEYLLVVYIVTDWCYYNHVSHWIQYFLFTYFLVDNVRGYHWISTHIINIYFLHVNVDQC